MIKQATTLNPEVKELTFGSCNLSGEESERFKNFWNSRWDDSSLFEDKEEHILCLKDLDAYVTGLEVDRNFTKI